MSDALACLVVVGLFGWWCQRDAWKRGVEYGRICAEGERLRREEARQLAERGEHLRVVK